MLTPTASEIAAALRSRCGAPVEADPHIYAEPVARAGAGTAHRARGSRLPVELPGLVGALAMRGAVFGPHASSEA